MRMEQGQMQRSLRLLCTKRYEDRHKVMVTLEQSHCVIFNENLSLSARKLKVLV